MLLSCCFFSFLFLFSTNIIILDITRVHVLLSTLVTDNIKRELRLTTQITSEKCRWSLTQYYHKNKSKDKHVQSFNDDFPLSVPFHVVDKLTCKPSFVFV